MGVLISLVILGAALLFVVPSVLLNTLGERRYIPFYRYLTRLLGGLIIALGVFSTSFVNVPDGHLAQLFSSASTAATLSPAAESLLSMTRMGRRHEYSRQDFTSNSW